MRTTTINDAQRPLTIVRALTDGTVALEQRARRGDAATVFLSRTEWVRLADFVRGIHSPQRVTPAKAMLRWTKDDNTVEVVG